MSARWLAAATVPLSFLACSFVLDFDELEDGGNTTRIGFGGAGGGVSVDAGGTGPLGGSTGGVGGSAAGQAGAEGGSGGGGSMEKCGGDCDDTDPCTRDRCATDRNPPTCVHDAQQGLLDDGFARSLTAETFHRATMVAGRDEFYLSAFRSSEGETETTLYSVPREGDEIVERFRATELGEGNPVSAMGLVADPGDDLVLHAYLGFVDAIGGGNPRVNHLRFDDLSSPTSTVAGFGYDPGVPSRYPKGFVAEGSVHGVWIDLGGSIAMHFTTGGIVTFNSNPGVPARATSLAPIASPTSPGVIFSRSRGGVFAELRGGSDVELDECHSDPEAYLSMRSLPLADTGVWLAGWTTSSQGAFTTETKLVVCTDDPCFSQACDVGEPVAPNVRHPADALMLLGESTWALATATPTSSEDGQAELTLALKVVDYGEFGVDEPRVEALGDEIVVAEVEAATDLEGPDLPALSFLPPDKLALSYIEPDPGLGVSALRVRRYHVCLPAD